METKNLQPAKPEETVNNTAQDSKTQSSAEEQKNNIPQITEKAAEENNSGSQKNSGKNPTKPSEKTNLAKPDILADDTAQIFAWLEGVNQNPRQLKDFLDTLDTRIELIDDVLSKQSEKSKRIPGIDRRIETLDLFDVQLETGERYLSELNKIKLQTELTNLKEKRFQVWQKFVKVCDSEKKALKYKNLRAKAKSQLYHKTAGYFIKQKILKILNTIIEKDKTALVEVKGLAEDTSEDGIKRFNEGLRDLLEVHDDDLAIQCSHHKREYYYQIFRLTILKWNPESDIQITEIVEPDESK
jgi:hypothetical protein